MTDTAVNPEVLQGFAESAAVAGRVVTDARVSAIYNSLAAALPGSSTAYAAKGASVVIRGPVAHVAGNYASITSATKNGAGQFQATENELSSRLAKIVPSK